MKYVNMKQEFFYVNMKQEFFSSLPIWIDFQVDRKGINLIQPCLDLQWELGVDCQNAQEEHICMEAQEQNLIINGFYCTYIKGRHMHPFGSLKTTFN